MTSSATPATQSGCLHHQAPRYQVECGVERVECVQCRVRWGVK
jgi:hypothetical protein